MSKAPSFGIRQLSDTPARATYFEPHELKYSITNLSSARLLIDRGTIQFQPDLASPPDYVDSTCGILLSPGGSAEIIFTYTPTPIYLENTNEVRIRLDYRVDTDGRIGPRLNEIHQGFYVIISPPAASLGDVFISYKQPENSRLATILERYTRRAGFVPHLFVRDPNVGADQWKLIESLIKASHSAFIVWASRTDWGNGVEREIQLCRDHGVREMLLIEHGIPLPPQYEGTLISYKRFDPEDLSRGVSEAVTSLRQRAMDFES